MGDLKNKGARRYSDVSFQHHILENPDHDTPQLVYADWLDEHRRPGAASRLRWMVDAKNHVRGASGRPKHPAYGVSYSYWSPRRPEWYARSMAAWMIHRKLSDFVSDHPSKAELSRLLGVAYSHAVGVVSDEERSTAHTRSTELVNQLDGEWRTLQEQGHQAWAPHPAGAHLGEVGFLSGDAYTASTLAGFAHAARYLTAPAPGPLTSASAMNAGLQGTTKEVGLHQKASYHFADFVNDNPPPTGQATHTAPPQSAAGDGVDHHFADAPPAAPPGKPDDATVIAAYARLRAEGDTAGCERLKAMTMPGGGKRFSEPHVPEHDDRAAPLLDEEAAFHAHFDANPDDHVARQVFADWLQERNDPRAEGYRALGVAGHYPMSHIGQHWLWNRGEQEPPYHNYNGQSQALPPDWHERIHPPGGANTFWSYHPTRRAADDAAAHAFAQLPPARRHELLNPTHDA